MSTKTTLSKGPKKINSRLKSALSSTPKGEGRERVYRDLLERILSLQLLPGSSLDETAMGKELGVSRTPLREAMVRLAAEGLVELSPNRGGRVAPIELPQLQEHLEAFELIQRSATVLAAQRRTKTDLVTMRVLCMEFEKMYSDGDVVGMMKSNLAFHQSIGVASGNRYVQKMYDSLLIDGLRVARLAMAYECYGSADNYEQHMQNILKEHRKLVQSIENQDVQAASKLADSHSDLARVRVSDYLSRSLTRGIQVQNPQTDSLSHV